MGCWYNTFNVVYSPGEDLVVKPNSIANHSDIMRFWDKDKNTVDPSGISVGSHARIHLKCEKGHEWEPKTKDFATGARRCPYCGGRKTTEENNLLVKHPELAKQFDLEKNGGVTPDQVHPGSHNKYWWKCEKEHSWKTSVDQRLNCGCPYCSGNKPSKENNLGTADPAILAEFDYEKNDFKPEDVTLGSNKPVAWKCSKCNGEWVAIVKSRVKLESGCPQCNESPGEKAVRNFLSLHNFKHKGQFAFKDKEMSRLKYDFAVWVNNELKLIEYHGEQHWDDSRYQGKYPSQTFESAQARDAKKAKYCEDNNIPLLIIPFWQINSIEVILEAWLN